MRTGRAAQGDADPIGETGLCGSWAERNQRYVQCALEDVLERLALGASDKRHSRAEVEARLSAIASGMLPGPALAHVTDSFGLSLFERDVLLLCAGMELNARTPQACAAARNAGEPYPTFGLALATLDGAHWSALAPDGPLRAWRLIEIDGPSPTASRLRIDERILHWCAGVDGIDERLRGFGRTLCDDAGLTAAQQRQARAVADCWSDGAQDAVIALTGDAYGALAVVARAAAALGMQTQLIHAGDLPPAGPEIATFVRLWEREARLTGTAVVVDCRERDAVEAHREALRLLLAQLPRIATLADAVPSTDIRPTVAIEAARATRAEQRAQWAAQLVGTAASAQGTLDAIVSTFSLSGAQIASAARAVLATGAPNENALGLWQACRARTSVDLGRLARRVESAATWDDLVLPPEQTQLLRRIVIHVRQRHRVHDEWGFAAKSERGLGTSALFWGPSGTGKTLAAEVLANELELDLFRIDLSRVVSKYIGETEKNLGRVFDAADAGSAILLFDEADALFGKRSDVRDSHDRYANIEVGYLLTRMEAYRGVAILATNMKQALDQAFLRRLRFSVAFPFPSTLLRAQIWRRTVPADAPVGRLNFEKLAQLDVAGGTIRNIALDAAFSAAARNESLDMADLLDAAQRECAKIEKPLAAAEIRGWV